MEFDIPHVGNNECFQKACSFVNFSTADIYCYISLLTTSVLIVVSK